MVHLAAVMCRGKKREKFKRVEELIVMVKSALIFTKARLKFHIFTDARDVDEFGMEV